MATAADADAEVASQKAEITTLLQKDESDEVKVEQETEALITQLESSPEDTTTAKKLIVQLEQDEEKVEKETEQLIQQLEQIEAKAETEQVALLPEPAAKTPAAAVEASVAETKELIVTLQDRSTSTEQYIEELKQQVGKASTTDFLKVLKDRVSANGDFLAKYDDFVARWKSR